MDNMCRYFGLSSTGVTYKSNAASFGSGSYSSGSRYGVTQSSKGADTSWDSYRGKEWSYSSKEAIPDFRRTSQMSIRNASSTTNYKSGKGEGHHRRYVFDY
jgi:epsin